jgi:hypothetical protein
MSDCQYQLMPAAESRFDAYGNKRVHSVRVKGKQGKDLPPSEGQPLEQAAPFILHRPSCCFCVHWFFFVPGRAFCTRLVAACEGLTRRVAVGPNCNAQEPQRRGWVYCPAGEINREGRGRRERVAALGRTTATGRLA